MPLTELPPKVKAFLPPSLTEAWLKAFNTALDEGRPDTYAYATSVALGDPDGVVNNDIYTFVVDLGKYKFDDTSVTWIQGMPLGTWQHPMYGKINATPEMIGEFVSNVKANTRGQDLDIDYDHKLKTTEAAGWVKDAEARSDGLWLAVEFTKDALSKVKEKAYRYFSPEFSREWKHPSTNVVHKNVLFGGALTNRPFLKGILPINLSEVIPDNTGDKMDLEKLRKTLDLPETASEDEILAAVEAAKAGSGKTDPPKNDPKTKTEDELKPDENGNVLVAASELVNLRESVSTLREETDLLKIGNRVQDIAIKLNEVNSNDKAKFAIAPSSQDELKALALDAPSEQYSEKLFKFVSGLLETGVVELGERAGSRRQASGDSKTASERLVKLTDEYQAEHKVTYREAFEAVALAEPELYDEYRNENYIKDKGSES